MTDEAPKARPPRPIPQSPERSRLLGRVRQKRTAPEEAVARVLRDLGIAYRRNVKTLPGSPDFANARRRFAIFVDGCFWHHHTGCRRATIPNNNRAFWEAKFAANRARDASAIRALRRRGFRVIVIWECELDGVRARLARRLTAASERPAAPPRPD